MLEKKVEERLVERVKEFGGIAPKFTSPGTSGVPDRIVIIPNGRVVFAETKRPKGGIIEPRQRRFHKLLKERNQDIRILNTYELVDEFIEEVKHEIQTTCLSGVHNKQDNINE